MSRLLDIIYGGNRRFFNGQALRSRFLFQDVNLDLAVHFAGAVNYAHILSGGNHLLQQFNLLFDGVHVRGTGNIGTRFCIILYQFRGFIIGNSRTYDRNIFRSVGYGLCGRGSDSADQVHFVVDKPVGDVLQVGLVRLGILPVKGDIFAFFKAVFGQPVNKAFISSIQGSVLYQLYDTYVKFLLRFRRRFFISAATACHSYCQRQHQCCRQCFHFRTG